MADDIRKIPLDDKGVEALERQVARFKEKFGRDPLPHEPVFFDPDYDNPVPYTEEKLERIIKTAIEKARENCEFLPPTEDILKAIMGEE